MWAIANIPLRVDYELFRMTVMESELFLMAPFEALGLTDRVRTISPEINPDNKLVKSFLDRLKRRLYLITPPFTVEKLNEVEKELIDRGIRATHQAIADELGMCRETISRLKIRALK